MDSNEKSQKKLVLTNAIVWAMMILASSFMLGDELSKSSANNMLIMHIIGWTIVQSAIAGRTLGEEVQCVKNLFSRKKT